MNIMHVLLLIGMIVSFAISLLVIKFLMDYIKKHDFKIFGIYRIALSFVLVSILFI
jgi:undecaprenyl-diphosphatase